MPDTRIGEYIWRKRYRASGDHRIEDTWRRVAGAAAGVEARDRQAWESRFYHTLEDFRFIPGGRILAGAGTGKNVTLCNCFVMGLIEDDMSAIFDSLRQAALTMQAGGGVGYDFSTLRPCGTRARTTGNIASGPVSFMHVWNTMCATLLSTGCRRGAMMATLRCDHPDIKQFVDAKRAPGALEHFNLSVLVSDKFMEAVDRNDEWPLVFPVRDNAFAETGDRSETVPGHWPGYPEPAPCQVLRKVSARDLWERIMTAAYAGAEPGVLFIDRINSLNNLGYREYLSCTNPCGEVPLPPWGACNLGSINLTRFVVAPFTASAHIHHGALEETVAVAVRFLDNILDCSRFPLPQQKDQAMGSRRVGLGVTGLADALMMLGLHYGSSMARDTAADIMRTLCHAAYNTSVGIAAEKGSFPWLNVDDYLHRPFIRGLPDHIRDNIGRDGIRNSHLLAVAPAGTISLLADNVSSGVEPVFAADQHRRVLDELQESRTFNLEDHACRVWRGSHAEPLPPAFVTAHQLDPEQHLLMQEALQVHVDNAISKTINIPSDYPLEYFRKLYRLAYNKGLKGCTTFRADTCHEAVLTQQGDSPCKPLS